MAIDAHLHLLLAGASPRIAADPSKKIQNLLSTLSESEFLDKNKELQ
jgi:hypothetical protein